MALEDMDGLVLLVEVGLNDTNDSREPVPLALALGDWDDEKLTVTLTKNEE